MFRSRRSLALLLVFMLISGSFAAVQRPSTAHAAGPFIVTTTRDLTGSTCGTPCSLRQALNAAIAAGGNAEIQFQLNTDDGIGPSPMPGFNATTSTWTITLGLVDTSLPVDANEPLPLISANNIYINGGSQATYSGLSIPGPLIFIDGTHVDNQGGLTVSNASDTRIHRLGIINFSGDPGIPGDLQGVGIELFSATNSEIRGCYIGVNQAGNAPAPNDAAGILIQSGSNNTIGGNNSLNSEYNVISGNTNDGILIRQGSTGNKIIGNRLGTDTTGTVAIPNGANGVQLTLNSSNNQIGPPAEQPANDATQRNIIAGNNGYGVQINGTSNNSVHGNWIGANNFFNIRMSNRLGGVGILSTNSLLANNNLVGGNTASTRNIISGNNGPGVSILGPNATNNKVANNYIGVGFSSSVAVSNTIGVLLSGGGDSNIIGGNGTTTLNNVISGNSQDGIRISGVSSNPASLNIISGNSIGVAPNGTTTMPNGAAGVVLGSYVQQTTVGGASAAASNTIVNNSGDGISISGPQNTASMVLKNTVQNNTGNGVQVANASNTTISGGDAAGANQITDNVANGIKITNSVSTTIKFNTLNLNDQNGVQVDGAAVDTKITNNTIYTNTLKAVLVKDSGTQRAKILDNSMQGNVTGAIDLTPENTHPLGNATNPNHDIDPPSQIRINQNGLLTGKVHVDASPSACLGCTIQIFTTNPTTLDGQGRDKVNVTVTVNADGSFSAPLGGIPQQFVVNATDSNGNTSEFALFDRSFGLAIGPSYPIPPALPRGAYPGQVISYTHRITNTGSVSFTDLQLSAFSKLGWSTQLAPANPISLAPNESKPVTLTLTLPTGSAPNVQAGLEEQTRLTIKSTKFVTVTASVTDTTTVLGRFILQVAPLARNGFGAPGINIDYTHQLTNTGNLTGTVNLSALTVDPATGLPLPSWTTTLTPTQITLTPGQAKATTARVAVPLGTTAGTVAKTRINVTASLDPAANNKIITDTTTVLLKPLATMVLAQEKDGAAGEEVRFCHTVTNNSNGTATFKLVGASSLGSKISFESNQPGVPLGSGNTFTVSDQPGSNIFNFCAKVIVDIRAQKGQNDTITIGLTDPQGNVIGGASVQDVIHVTRGAVIPRVYMPLILK